MRYISFASGSTGNCALAQSGNVRLLVDAGVSARRVCGFLSELGLELADLAGVVVTHEHRDHVAGLKTLTKRSPLPVYASGGTARALLRDGKCAEENLRVLDAGAWLELGGMRVRGFKTPHDAAEPFGFRLEDERGALAVVTDLGCVPEAVREAVAGCRAAVVEANHDVELLRRGAYPQMLKTRILSARGHLSNEAGAELAFALAGAGAEEILLAHLSRENNRPELALAAARRRLGGEVRLHIAPPEAFSAVMEF